MALYLEETARVLKPGGRALFHRSVYSENPTGAFTDSIHWRNYTTSALFAHFASRAGLKISESELFPLAREIATDGLTLLAKPAS